MDKKCILVVYHKQAELLSGDDFLPINAGRMVASPKEIDWLEKNTVGDDSGINISSKNSVYNELTAIYWVWKNTNYDYYGLMHYRRFFIFEQKSKPFFSVSRIKGDIKEKIKYSQEKLDEIMKNYDFIAPMPMKRKSVYEHYKNAHDASDLDFAENYISTRYPQFAKACRDYYAGRDAYFYNMFVFDRETFNQYCEFIFNVLAACEHRFENKRMYISERLTGVFITYLISEGKKGLFLPTLYVDKKPSLKTAISQTKKNMAERKLKCDKGAKSFLYAVKPLLTIFVPSFVFRIYRNRK